MHYLYVILVAAVLLLVLKYVFNVSYKTLGELVLNVIPNIPINVITALVVGIFGLPGVIVLILLYYFGVF